MSQLIHKLEEQKNGMLEHFRVDQKNEVCLNVYRMSKKSRPFLYSKFTMDIRQDIHNIIHYI